MIRPCDRLQARLGRLLRGIRLHVEAPALALGGGPVRARPGKPDSVTAAAPRTAQSAPSRTTGSSIRAEIAGGGGVLGAESVIAPRSLPMTAKPAGAAPSRTSPASPVAARRRRFSVDSTR